MVQNLARTTAVLALLVGLAACAEDDGSAPDALPTPLAVTSSPTPTFTPSPEPEITVPSTTPSATATPTSALPVTEAPPEDPLASQSPIETAPPTGQPVCAAGDLTLTDADAVITPTTVQELFVVRTTGPDCELTGYPVVELRDASGAVVPATYRPGGFGLPAERPAPHALSTGTSVSFYVASARSGDCVQAARASVRLPGTSGPLSAATSFAVCDGSVGLSPVRRETGLE